MNSYLVKKMLKIYKTLNNKNKFIPRKETLKTNNTINNNNEFTIS